MCDVCASWIYSASRRSIVGTKMPNKTHWNCVFAALRCGNSSSFVCTHMSDGRSVSPNYTNVPMFLGIFLLIAARSASTGVHGCMVYGCATSDLDSLQRNAVCDDKGRLTGAHVCTNWFYDSNRIVSNQATEINAQKKSERTKLIFTWNILFCSFSKQSLQIVMTKNNRRQTEEQMHIFLTVLYVIFSFFFLLPCPLQPVRALCDDNN